MHHFWTVAPAAGRANPMGDGNLRIGCAVSGGLGAEGSGDLDGETILFLFPIPGLLFFVSFSF
jgi:hypothetical protein